MKLQKRLSRKYKDKSYHKYLINIPEEEIKKAELKEGDNLEIETSKYRVVLRKIEKAS